MLKEELAKLIERLDDDEEINIEFSRNDRNDGFIMGIAARRLFDNDIILIAEHGSQYTMCLNDNCFGRNYETYLDMAEKVVNEYDMKEFKIWEGIAG